ncbi:hypothetical protein BB559_000353 [Furculomyces boomerangus]|uniref:CCZ1/INTU/HSP4 first Longin domain-containing protein n=2 Tax=Harpellales TaxID=61421 RepID=A0A2T9Z5F6_9FUNG|nr:hypothetical protein BB559_000353 [Furculomyces boomerangus]PWA01650.1 hypothetical protein BB558_002228 [Smittium angustum]
MNRIKPNDLGIKYYGINLLYFAVYAPQLSKSEDDEYEKILYYVASNPPPFYQSEISEISTKLNSNPKSNNNTTHPSNIPYKNDPSTSSKIIIKHKEAELTNNNLSKQNPKDNLSLDAGNHTEGIFSSNEKIVSLEVKLLQIGLGQALSEFNKNFQGNNDESSLKTKKTIVVVEQVQPGIWVILSVCVPRKVTSKPTEKDRKASSTLQKFEVEFLHNRVDESKLRNFIKLEFETFSLLKGNTTEYLTNKNRIKILKKSLSNHFGTIIWSWNKRWENSLDEYGPEKQKNVVSDLNDSPGSEFGLLDSLGAIPRHIIGKNSIKLINKLFIDTKKLKMDYSTSFNPLYESELGLNISNLGKLDLKGLLVFNQNHSLVWSSFIDTGSELGKKNSIFLNNSGVITTKSIGIYIKKILVEELFNSKQSLETDKLESGKVENVNDIKIDHNSSIVRKNIKSFAINSDSETEETEETESNSEHSSGFSSPFYEDDQNPKGKTEFASNLINNLENPASISLTGVLSTVVTALVEPNQGNENKNSTPFVNSPSSNIRYVPSKLVSKKAPPILAKETISAASLFFKGGSLENTRNPSLNSLSSIHTTSSNVFLSNKNNLNKLIHLEQHSSKKNNPLASGMDQPLYTTDVCGSDTTVLISPIVTNNNHPLLSSFSGSNKPPINRDGIIWIREPEHVSLKPTQPVIFRYNNLVFVYLVGVDDFIKVLKSLPEQNNNDSNMSKANIYNRRLNRGSSVYSQRSSVGGGSSHNESQKKQLLLECYSTMINTNIQQIKSLLSLSCERILYNTTSDFGNIVSLSKQCLLPGNATKIPLVYVDLLGKFAFSNLGNEGFLPLGYESRKIDDPTCLINFLPNSFCGVETSKNINSKQNENLQSSYPSTSNSNKNVVVDSAVVNTDINKLNTAILDTKPSVVNNSQADATSNWNPFYTNFGLPTNMGMKNWFTFSNTKSPENIGDSGGSNEGVVEANDQDRLAGSSNNMNVSKVNVITSESRGKPLQSQQTGEDGGAAKSNDVQEQKSWSFMGSVTSYIPFIGMNLDEVSADGGKNVGGGLKVEKKGGYFKGLGKVGVIGLYFPEDVVLGLMNLQKQFEMITDLNEQFIKIPKRGWIAAKRTFLTIEKINHTKIDTKTLTKSAWYCYVNSERATLSDIKVYMQQVSAAYFNHPL